MALHSEAPPYHHCLDITKPSFHSLDLLHCDVKSSEYYAGLNDLGYDTDDFPNTEVLYQFHTTEEEVTHFFVSLLPSDNSKAYKWIVPCHVSGR
jgi:hypothetical protein